MNYSFLFGIIYSRFAGTGIHLDLGNKNIISYKKYRIWGIKSFIQTFSEDIYRKIVQNLPQSNRTYSSDLLISPLQQMGTLLQINSSYLEEEFDLIRNVKEAWLSMDSEQKSAFLLNAFIVAMERTAQDQELPRFMALGMIPNFQLANFGFLFRAYSYTHIANQNLYYNGFLNLEHRLEQAMLQEYRETILNPTLKPATSASNKPSEKPINQDVITQLKSQDANQILSAIKYIESSHLISVVDELEYLFSHENEMIQERALEVVMKLKNLD